MTSEVDAQKGLRERTARFLLFTVLDMEKALGRAETDYRRQLRRFPDGHQYVDQAKRRLAESEAAATNAWEAAVYYAISIGIVGAAL